MRAIVQARYGSADVLELAHVAKPSIGDDQVLVRVRATSVGAWVTHMMEGDPHAMRVAFGIRRPRQAVRASDFAGEVVALGTNVRGLDLGDHVFGECEASFAEFAAASPESMARKPSNLTFAEAAAVPIAAQTALLGLRDRGEVRPGQRVLIIGAAGGVGTFAVQIARILGAEVTGVCSTQSVELVRALGAHHVIDYTERDVIAQPDRFDVVLQLAGSNSLAELRGLLTVSGTLVLTSGEGGRWFGPLGRLAQALVVSPFVRHDLRTFVAASSTENLDALTAMIEGGDVKPVIDRSYPLEQTADAIRRFQRGHNQGKIVVTT